MARLKLLEIDEVEPMAQEIYQKAEEASGRVINLFKGLAYSPKILRDWNRLGITLLLKSKLSRKLLELAIIRVGELAQAEYELTAHRGIGLAVGLTQEQIDEMTNWRNSDKFDEAECAILQYTDEVAQNIRATDETFSELQKHFDEKEIVELTTAIGFYGMVCRFLENIQIDPEKP